MRQLTHRVLARIPVEWIGGSGVFDERFTAQPKCARGSVEPGAAVAKAVDVAGQRDLGLNLQFIRRAQVRHARGMHIQHRDHGHGRRNVELDVVAQADEHAEV